MINQHLKRIILNRIKINAIDFLLDICVGSLHEYRRGKAAGAFDLFSQDGTFTAETQNGEQFNPHIEQNPTNKTVDHG